MGLSSLPGPLSDSVSSSDVLNNRDAAKNVQDARRSINAGQANEAIPQLLHVVSAFPNSPAAVDARYWLGVAYYDINSYVDSAAMFAEYRALAPEGKHAAQCGEYTEKISREYARRNPAPEQFDQAIASARAALKSKPDDLDTAWRLADLLWRRGDYDEAARMYAGIARRHPEYRNDLTLKRRVEVQPDGSYVALTPAEVQRRAEQAAPLVVTNTNGFKSGRDSITQLHRYYVVTGQAVNQGDSALYGVEVTITIFGLGNVVYDTATVRFPRLNPGEGRAFSVRFSNFENIESIERYECVGTFQR